MKRRCKISAVFNTSLVIETTEHIGAHNHFSEVLLSLPHLHPQRLGHDRSWGSQAPSWLLTLKACRDGNKWPCLSSSLRCAKTSRVWSVPIQVRGQRRMSGDVPLKLTVVNSLSWLINLGERAQLWYEINHGWFNQCTAACPLASVVDGCTGCANLKGGGWWVVKLFSRTKVDKIATRIRWIFQSISKAKLSHDNES